MLSLYGLDWERFEMGNRRIKWKFKDVYCGKCETYYWPMFLKVGIYVELINYSFSLNYHKFSFEFSCFNFKCLCFSWKRFFLRRNFPFSNLMIKIDLIYRIFQLFCWIMFFWHFWFLFSLNFTEF